MKELVVVKRLSGPGKSLCLVALLVVAMLLCGWQQATKLVVMPIGGSHYTAAGVPKPMDAAPFIQEGRTYVPVRFVAEELSAVADWEPKDRPVELVTLTRGDMQILITIGLPLLVVIKGTDQYVIESDAAALIRDGRTFLPFRVIAEAFGAVVDYGPKDASVRWVSFEL